MIKDLGFTTCIINTDADTGDLQVHYPVVRDEENRISIIILSLYYHHDFLLFDSTYYTFNIYSYNYQHDSSTGVSASGYSAKVPNKMKPLVIYENTSSTSITVSFDNSIYDGGMPIL